MVVKVCISISRKLLVLGVLVRLSHYMDAKPRRDVSNRGIFYSEYEDAPQVY